MTPKRPVGVLVLGILNIVFGLSGLVLVCGCGLGAIVFFSAAVDQPPPAKGDPFSPLTVYFRVLNEELPSYRWYFVAFTIFVVVDSVWATAVGVGLLRMKRWAWTWGLAYAIVVTALYLGSTAYELAAHAPADARIVDRWPALIKTGAVPATPAPNNPLITVALAIGNLLYNVLFAAAQVIVLTRPGVRQAFRPNPQGDADEDIPEVGSA